MFGDIIKDGVQWILENTIYKLLYGLERILCIFIGYMQGLFDIFTGVATVTYNKDPDAYLINVFFGNSAISGIYWGMAAIGVLLSFVFAVIAVIRKLFDIDDKVQASFGRILRTLLKSVLIILSLNVAMTVVLTFTNELMGSVNSVFDKSKDIVNGSPHIEFSNEQYAAMSRVLNTVGNYSLNPSHNNRYNINACYNEIRSDLGYLDSTGMFKYDYLEPESDGKTPEQTWQSALQELVMAADYNKEIPLDVYNEGIANAVINCMDELRNDSSFHALESFDRKTSYNKKNLDLGRVLFVIGTMGIGDDAAARNDSFNKSPDIYDNLRKPYLIGTKDAYNLNVVNKDFSISPTKTNYLVVYIAGTTLLGIMAIIILNCIVRIFNLMFMYIIAPPIIAVSPLDDGGKFKQWLTAFIVQAFSVFATVISMRLFLIFVPIIISPDLKLSSNPVIDILGKILMVVAAAQAVLKANGLLTGILADQAGMQSLYAGDMQNYAKNSKIGRAALGLKDAIDSIPTKSLSALWGKMTGGGKDGSGGGGNSALPDNQSGSGQGSGGGELPGNQSNGEGAEGGELPGNQSNGEGSEGGGELPGNQSNGDGAGSGGSGGNLKQPPPMRAPMASKSMAEAQKLAEKHGFGDLFNPEKAMEQYRNSPRFSNDMKQAKQAYDNMNQAFGGGSRRSAGQPGAKKASDATIKNLFGQQGLDYMKKNGQAGGGVPKKENIGGALGRGAAAGAKKASDATIKNLFGQQGLDYMKKNGQAGGDDGNSDSQPLPPNESANGRQNASQGNAKNKDGSFNNDIQKPGADGGEQNIANDMNMDDQPLPGNEAQPLNDNADVMDNMDGQPLPENEAQPLNDNVEAMDNNVNDQPLPMNENAGGAQNASQGNARNKDGSFNNDMWSFMGVQKPADEGGEQNNANNMNDQPLPGNEARPVNGAPKSQNANGNRASDATIKNLFGQRGLDMMHQRENAGRQGAAGNVQKPKSNNNGGKKFTAEQRRHMFGPEPDQGVNNNGEERLPNKEE